MTHTHNKNPVYKRPVNGFLQINQKLICLLYCPIVAKQSLDPKTTNLHQNTDQFGAVSTMSKLRMVNWPMRSAGLNIESPFHGQAFWLVSQMADSVFKDRIVVTATQFDGHFTCDGFGYPALCGFAQHQGL